jgi:hypothetical protein
MLQQNLGAMKMRRQTRHVRLGLALVFLAAGLATWTGARPVLRTVSYHDDFASGSLDHWLFPYPEDWEILSEGSGHYLHMKRSRAPGVPRRPLQFARLQRLNMASFELSLRIRRAGRSMIVVFNYVDTMHFYYTHLSQDRGSDQPVHNGIFIVNGGPRERIAGLEAPPALPDRGWHRVRIQREAFAGSIKVFVDDQDQPLFAVNDTTFRCGQIGLGSFDETGDFADLRLTAQDVDCSPGGKAVVRPACADQGQKAEGRKQ